MAYIDFASGVPGAFLIINGDRNVLIQSDQDFAQVARSMGWVPCLCGQSDGTVACDPCKRDIVTMAIEADQWISAREGMEFNNLDIYLPDPEPGFDETGLQPEEEDIGSIGHYLDRTARAHAETKCLKQGYDHFRSWKDGHPTKPYALAHKKVGGDYITTVFGAPNNPDCRTTLTLKSQQSQRTRPTTKRRSKGRPKRMTVLLRYAKELGERDRKLLTKMAKLLVKHNSEE